MLEIFTLGLNATFQVVFYYVCFKFSSWLYQYVKLVWVINKIPGERMLPFIGNWYEISLLKSGMKEGINLYKKFR